MGFFGCGLRAMTLRIKVPPARIGAGVNRSNEQASIARIKK
jgi:hypothetical protein